MVVSVELSHMVVKVFHDSRRSDVPISIKVRKESFWMVWDKNFHCVKNHGIAYGLRSQVKKVTVNDIQAFMRDSLNGDYLY
jgi:hypothetical protein